jgi:hypothetical protein
LASGGWGSEWCDRVGLGFVIGLQGLQTAVQIDSKKAYSTIFLYIRQLLDPKWTQLFDSRQVLEDNFRTAWCCTHIGVNATTGNSLSTAEFGQCRQICRHGWHAGEIADLRDSIPPSAQFCAQACSQISLEEPSTVPQRFQRHRLAVGSKIPNNVISGTYEDV